MDFEKINFEAANIKEFKYKNLEIELNSREEENELILKLLSNSNRLRIENVLYEYHDNGVFSILKMEESQNGTQIFRFFPSYRKNVNDFDFIYLFPIGTTVDVSNNELPLLITARCIVENDVEYNYLCYSVPNGNLTGEYFLINNSDIKSVYSFGYQGPENDEYMGQYIESRMK